MKKFKKISLIALSAILAVNVLTACGSTKPSSQDNSQSTADSGKVSGDVLVWHWNPDAIENYAKQLKTLYPELNITALGVKAEDYMTKLQSSLASGADIPDVIYGELGFRGRLFDLGILDALEQSPYNVDRADMFDFAVPTMLDPEGKLVGVDESIAPAGLGYNVNMAEKYLGTSDPDEIATMFKDWDAFIQKGKEIAQATNGKVKMIPGLDSAVKILSQQDTKSYIDGDTIHLTDRYHDCLDMAIKMYQDGLIGKLDCFSPGWNNSFKEDKFMFYNLAVWGIDWTVMANDPDGAGEWRVTRAPGKGYTYGGTSVSIYKDSKNKQGAWAFVKYIYTPGEGSEYSFETNALLPCFKSAYEDYSFYSEKGPFDDFFGGQNITKYYFDNLTDGLEGQVQTKHESTVQTALYKIVPIVYQDSNITADEAIKEIAKEIKTISPEVTID